MTKTIISLIGYNRSGKSTTAKMIKDVLKTDNQSSSIQSFATPLKNIAREFCDYSEDKKNTGQRVILESLATMMKKELGNEIFAYALLNRIQNCNSDYVIIDDLRFSHELGVIAEFYPVMVILIPNEYEPEEYDVKRLNKLLKYAGSNGYYIYKPQKITKETLSRIVLRD